ncbi:glutathione S-transferase D1-like [Rhipicephalus sanguineus]|uniref:glutathione S-transferase D1-like n=1 Tax=Rhipicephalus sanguineus TaxID=34632 RepID=UPI001893D05E|nr:glutathione S-transferase D1-like [Rhipicephalus sanguineus]
MPVTLYNQYGSPPCGFVRMVARHVGVDLKLNNMDMFKGDHVTPEYLKEGNCWSSLQLNPYHKAPTIDDDGFILYESSAIAYYLINKYAPASTLYPSCSEFRAQVDQVLATVTSTIQHHYFTFFLPVLRRDRLPGLQEYYASVKAALPYFDEINQHGIDLLNERLKGLK